MNSSLQHPNYPSDSDRLMFHVSKCFMFQNASKNTLWTYLVRWRWWSGACDETASERPDVKTSASLIMYENPDTSVSFPFTITITTSMWWASNIRTYLSSPRSSLHFYWLCSPKAYIGWAMPCTGLWPGLRYSVSGLLSICLFARWEHRPSTKERHRFLSVAIFSIFLLVYPISFGSFSVSLCQVFRGLPLLLFPGGLHVMTWRVIVSGGFLSVCPIHLHFLFFYFIFYG